jgi:hypothetical protein
MATDIALAVSNFEAMSEQLSLFLVLASTLFLLPGRIATRYDNGRIAVGGLVLALAILTRPAVLFLPVIYILGFLWDGLRQGRLPAALGKTALLGLILLLCVGPWLARNYATFGVPRLTSIDVNNVVYYFGAGAYQVEHDVSLQEAQNMISKDFGLPSYRVAMNPWIENRSVSEVYAELDGAKNRVVSKYPAAILRSSALGILKASFSHSAGELSSLLGKEWIAPEAGAILRGDAGALGRLRQNEPLLVGVAGWQVVHAAVTLVLGMIGAVVTLRTQQGGPAGIVLLAILAYFCLTIALFGLDTYWRCRLPMVPFLDAFAALGMCRLLPRAKAPRDAIPIARRAEVATH